MNEPRRLNQSSGIAGRLLASAVIDRPSAAARRRAEGLAGTLSAFSSTGSDAAAAPARPHVGRTLATWALIGAAASVSLALLGNYWLDGSSPQSSAAAPMAELSALPPPSASPAAAQEAPPAPPAKPTARDAKPPVSALRLSAAPLGSIEPWVPSVPRSAARSSSASFDEATEIQAARVAVSHGDATSALATLDRYDRGHPQGELKPESMVLRVQALQSSGKVSEARTLANEFARKYPSNPLVSRMNAVGR